MTKKIIDEIYQIAKRSDMPSCLVHGPNCDNCRDDVTKNGKRCMYKGLRDILRKCEELKK